MDTLTIDATKQTPELKMDGMNGVFSISGKSYPENVHDFYIPIFDYIEVYKLQPKTKTTIEFDWLYYNTATSKIIIKLILALKNVSNDFEVIWYCKRDLSIMIEKGEEIKEVLDINLKIMYR